MNTENEITINDVTYVRKEAEGEELRLVIVDNRGLTLIGYVDIYSERRILTVRDARCVIRWGTTEHLAELVNGPTENTRLGAKADAEINNDIIISYRLGEVWKDYLANN